MADLAPRASSPRRPNSQLFGESETKAAAKNDAARARRIPNNPQGPCALGGLFSIRARRGRFFRLRCGSCMLKPIDSDP